MTDNQRELFDSNKKLQQEMEDLSREEPQQLQVLSPSPPRNGSVGGQVRNPLVHTGVHRGDWEGFRRPRSCQSGCQRWEIGSEGLNAVQGSQFEKFSVQLWGTRGTAVDFGRWQRPRGLQSGKNFQIGVLDALEFFMQILVVAAGKVLAAAATAYKTNVRAHRFPISSLDILAEAHDRF